MYDEFLTDIAANPPRVCESDGRPYRDIVTSCILFVWHALWGILHKFIVTLYKGHPAPSRIKRAMRLWLQPVPRALSSAVIRGLP